MSVATSGYRHVQRAPLCLLLYAMAAMFLTLAWVLRDAAPIRFVFPIVGGLILLLATAFHHLAVSDEGDRLSIRFGPLPLLGRSLPYEQIESVEVGKTSLLDGWGIHYSLRGGWVWNLWGWDCVVLRLGEAARLSGAENSGAENSGAENGGPRHQRTLRVGTDDADNLARFLMDKIRQD